MSTQPLLQRTAAKRIALPVRVEPKVSFANERTFLSWLHFTVVLGGLAVGLLNFGDKVGKISAAMFSFVAMAIMVYALYTYHWRAASIRRGGRGPYDDRFGPVRLVCSLFVKVSSASDSTVPCTPHCHHRQFHPALHTIRAIVHRSL